MRKVLKGLTTLILTLLMMIGNIHFIMAAYTPAKLPVTVKVRGVQGTVQVSNWPGTMKDPRYRTDGPLPSVTETTIGAERTYDFEFEFSDFGNYVYKIEEPASLNTDPSVEYDKRVYRFYITVIDDGTGTDTLMGVVEAEDCGINGESCPYDDKTPVPVTPSTEKEDEVVFTNKQGYWVRYTNGEEPYYYYGGNPDDPDDPSGRHGTSSEYNDGEPCETKKPYNSYPYKNNNVTPDSGWQFTGQYKYVITRDKVDPETGLKILDSRGRPVQEEIPEEEYLVSYPDQAKAEEKAISMINSTSVPGKYVYNGVEYDTYEEAEAAAKDSVQQVSGKYVVSNLRYPNRAEAEEEAIHSIDSTSVPGKYIFQGTEYDTFAEAEAAARACVVKDTNLIDTLTGEKIPPRGYTNDPKSIQVKGNITFIPIYEPAPKPSPSNPPKPSSTPGSGWWVPYTGDPTSLMLYGGMFIGSVAVIIFLLLSRKKENNTF